MCVLRHNYLFHIRSNYWLQLFANIAAFEIRNYLPFYRLLDISIYATSLLLDRRSIDLSGAQEKEDNFHYKNFLQLQNEVSHAIPAQSSQNLFTVD